LSFLPDKRLMLFRRGKKEKKRKKNPGPAQAYTPEREEKIGDMVTRPLSKEQDV